MFKLLIIVLIISFVVSGGAEAKNVEQQTSSDNCPVYCMCGCEAETNGDPICLPCLSEWTNDDGDDHRMRQSIADSFEKIRAASNLPTDKLVKLLMKALNRVMPILQTVLTGDNIIEDQVNPLVEYLLYIVDLIQMVLKSLDRLSVLGPGGLLGMLLQGLIGQD